MSTLIYERVASWNSKRYDREYNNELTCNLLTEEYTEFLHAMQAQDHVEVLDGLCDVIYVALGAVWKLNLTEAEMQIAQDAAMNQVDLCEELELHPGNLIATCILQLNNDQGDKCFLLNMIVFLAIAELYCLGYNDEDVFAAMTAVCDSNDSKSIKKTSSDVKANNGDKGEYYIAPTAKLAAIVKNKAEIVH